MIICPSCGAQNDSTNRFCDQCGTRLTGAATSPAVPVPVSPDQPTALAPTCPACGTTVLPGERFCDNCGADLLTTPVAPPSVTPDQATLIAPSVAAQVFCPDCGDPALPGERFCDNCGADLSKLKPVPAADAPTVFAPPPATGPVVSHTEATLVVPPAAAAEPVTPPPATGPVVSHTEATLVVPPAAAEPVTPPPATGPAASDTEATLVVPPAAAEPVTPPPATGPAASDTEATLIAPPPAAEPMPVAPSPAAGPVPAAPSPATEPVAAQPAPPAGATMSDIAAERARLEGLLAAHRDTVAQYEQMAARYPAGSVPSFIMAGLDAARAELAKTEAALAALPSGPDPAEVARLEALLAAHRDTVAQYEQMAARYPAGSVPSFIMAGLDAARAELAKTEADLAALIGNAPTASSPTHFHPAAPTPIATPIVETSPVVARLILADGSEIMLPPGKSEYVIGREDPVSNIFPEIDLTPYGGETGGVSRQHARIVCVGNQWSIIDLNSTNHTRVNGNRIEPQTPTPISDGTKLQFGRLVATFRLG